MNPAGGTARRTDWPAVARDLVRDDERGALDATGLERLGLALELTGRQAGAISAWDRAHRAHIALGDRSAAARCVFWIGFSLGGRGSAAQAGAWSARLADLAIGEPENSSTVTLLVLAQAAKSWSTGDVPAATARFERAVALADRLDDPDLQILALMGCGRAMVAQGDAERGFACMDRVMLAIASGRAGDLVAGAAYCAVIASCLTRRDLARAREWTNALSDWCDDQVGLVPFRGTCLLHRATLMHIGGAWPEAHRILHGLVDIADGVLPGERAYREAELLRLTGREDDAERAYRDAAAAGRDPQPGLALLRLQQGRTTAAVAGVSRALSTDPSLGDRADLLDAACEIRRTAGDLDGARDAARALRALADDVGTSYVRAQADRALGRVLISEGRPDAALPVLRRAWTAWCELGAPYEAAATRAGLALAARAVGDEDGARMDSEAARQTFEALGAEPDVKRIDEACGASPAPTFGPLTPREVEVVRQVARGLSNREIAGRLFLSERTVARHVGNVLAKLQLANRAAVTAFAYQHGLVTASD